VPSDPDEQGGAGFSRILVVDDEEPMRHMLELVLRRAGFEVLSAASGEVALELVERESVDVVLSDVRMPGLDGLAFAERLSATHPEITLVMMSAFGTVELALEAMQRGAYDYISKPFKQDEVILTLRKAEERLRLRRENASLRARLTELELGGGVEGGEFVGRLLIHSKAMRKLAKTVRRVALFETTVLVLGESGVGKELVSRALHDLGGRAAGPFVAVNCGAIPEGLLESELFGHARGAFTDATSDKPGLFEAAAGGTIFLDEIGELPISVQVKLLRALQEREIKRLGENRARAIDVRVVAATSRPLEQMVEDGEFREDLYYRLAVMPLRIPALRERREDIAILSEHFLRNINKRIGTHVQGLDAETRRILLAYDWPGNVRELEHVVERAVALAELEVIQVADLGFPCQGAAAYPASFRKAKTELIASFERAYIEKLLLTHQGNIAKAAQAAQKNRRAFWQLIRKHHIDVQSFKGNAPPG
jgi:DNA-binding NtrC family response regulator